MTRYLPVFAALAVSLMSGAFVPSLKASEWDKRTTMTISQPVAVEGTILPAGQYVLTLLNSESERDIVYIFNGEGTRLITSVLAIHAVRSQPTGETAFSFYDSSAGQPPALHTWFYPGDDNGLEFLQPQNTAAATSTAALAPPGKAMRSRKPAAATESDAGGGN